MFYVKANINLNVYKKGSVILLRGLQYEVWMQDPYSGEQVYMNSLSGVDLKLVKAPLTWS